MNEVKRLKVWYKKRIEDWDGTVCTLGFISIVLNLLVMIYFIATKGAIGLLFLFSVIVQTFGINFLVHEHEIERDDENLRIFLKKVDKCFKIVTTSENKVEIASHNYQTIPYDMLMKALEDYGFCAKNPSWESFTQKDYDKGSMLYLIRAYNI